MGLFDTDHWTILTRAIPSSQSLIISQHALGDFDQLNGLYLLVVEEVRKKVSLSLFIIFHYLRRIDLTQCVWMVVSIQNRENTPGMNIASGAFATVPFIHMNCPLFYMCSIAE